MGLPTEPVLLTPQQVADLYAELRKARHDVNNKLACIQACVDLVLYKQNEIHRLSATVREQSAATISTLGNFSTALEKSLGITLPLQQ
jgi:hypothetical protein